ncbi:hypothetical protein AYI69_g3971 [Smittium culicis]|uniref:Uncharacterized protein n=1 Tax=Smittium culicis TaxID=133412 RepID=A0A1R1YIB8_9FUNG|nr:hypothetical protein AYI69_g3971 [Smittium culicis]
MPSTKKSDSSMDSNGEVFRRKPVEFQNELKTKEDYIKMIAEMKATNARDIDVISASLSIIGKIEMPMLLKLVTVGLIGCDLYLIYSSYFVGFFEMLFWSLPTAVLTISFFFQLTANKSTKSIEKYEKNVMKKFKD